jgi:threonine aldolase
MVPMRENTSESLGLLNEIARELSGEQRSYVIAALSSFKQLSSEFERTAQSSDKKTVWSENFTPGEARMVGALMASAYKARTVGLSPYGGDPITEWASSQIRRFLAAPKAETYFVSTGTAANAFALFPYVSHGDAVLTTRRSHVRTMEANSVETNLSGVALETIKHDGRIEPSDIRAASSDLLSGRADQRRIISAVMISNPSEDGEVYSLAELQAIRAACDSAGIPLGIDAARFPYQSVGDFSEIISGLRIADFVTLSLTKVGGISGAAIVFPSGCPRAEALRRRLKSAGHALDSVYITASQFGYLFSSDDRAIDGARELTLAGSIQSALEELGLAVRWSGSNTVLVLMPESLISRLSKRHTFYIWRAESSADHPDRGKSFWIRLNVSQTTQDSDIAKLVGDVAEYSRSHLSRFAGGW